MPKHNSKECFAAKLETKKKNMIKKKQAKNIPSKKNNGLVTVATLMPIVSFQCATYTHENDGRDTTRNSQ